MPLSPPEPTADGGGPNELDQLGALIEQDRAAREAAGARPGLPGTIVDPPQPQSAFDRLPKTGEELATMGIGPATDIAKEALAESGLPQNYSEMGSFISKQFEGGTSPAKMRGMLRGGGAAGGGFAGFAAGGPVGSAVGTVAGSALGGYLANVYDSLHETQQASGEKPDIMKSYLDPLKDALIDGSITGGTSVALPYVTKGSKFLLSKLLRLPPNSKELLKEASDIGVEIGVANLAKSGPGRVAVNALGRIPIIGGSAQNAARLQAKQLVASANDLFGDIATPRVASEVSQEAYDIGMKKFTDFATGIQRRFEHASRVGDEAGPIVPSKGIKEAAQAAIDKFQSLPGGISVWLPHADQKMLKSIVNSSEKLTTNDIKSIDVFLENAIRRTDSKTNITLPPIQAVRDAADKALGGVDHPAAKLMAGVQTAFKDGVGEITTDVAKQMGRLERNVYATGQIVAGKKGPEEMLDLVNSLNTPNKIAQARSLMGDDVVKQAARVRLDTAWQKARISEEGQPFKWSAEKFTKEIGLDNPNGHKYAAFKEMLKGTHVDIRDLEKLARVAETVSHAPVADVSTFMARAAALRGAGGFGNALKGALTLGIASGGGGGAAGAHGIISTLSMMWLARQGVGAFMRPGMLKAAVEASDVDLAIGTRVAGLYHLIENDTHVFSSMVDSFTEGGQSAVEAR